jgi:hypothetical protein
MAVQKILIRHPPDGCRLRPNLRRFRAPGKPEAPSKSPFAPRRLPLARAGAGSSVSKADSPSTKTHVSYGF